jgi:hypothetical protein
MAVEVTKKDLQAVQAQLNNKINSKIADLEKRINAKLQAIVDSTNKALEALRKFDEDSSKFDAEIKKVIDQHGQLINGLHKKCD